MSIDNLTYGEMKKIAAMFGGEAGHTTPHIGKKCIVRTYASGVHFGTVVAQHGRQIELRDARRLWRWDAKDYGISLSEVANHGGTSGRHRFCETVREMTILDALEIIPCTQEAISAIEAAPVSQAS